MSIVLCVCGSNFSITMGDGRLVRLEDNKPIHEKIQKVYKMNDGVSLGFVGDPIVAETALEKLQQYNLKKLSPEKIKQLYVEKLKTVNLGGKGVRAIISGKDKNNKFYTYEIDTNNNYDGKIYDDIPRNGFAVSVACSNLDLIEPIVQKHLYDTHPWGNIENLKTHMRECIIDVSTVDDTVNSNIFEVMIL